MITSYDFCIIGGGIIGLTTAYQLNNHFTDARILILEKERSLATHQSGRNSGVMHSGIYYTPDSLKAKTCRSGKKQMETFCVENEIPFELCGKTIVATHQSEIPRLHNIYERGTQNGINCSLIDSKQLNEIEPFARGIEAIYVPEAGIVDYTCVATRIGEILTTKGQNIHYNEKVKAIKRRANHVQVSTDRNSYEAKCVINCSGLYSDHLVRLAGDKPPAKIVPFRGEYFELTGNAKHLCRNLIYPVPDPAFPFLGVHFTRMINGKIECGPNAVLALCREGYDWWKIKPFELSESLTYGGFRKLASKHWKMGISEIYRSLSKTAFLRALQKLIPSLTIQQLSKGRSGVRAQALKPDGTLIDDFLVIAKDRVIHVCNAPSPAATASFAIANHIKNEVDTHIKSLRNHP
jgi:L-2-hydroxyglutarate oxidase